MKIGTRTYLVNMHMCAKSWRLHNRIFRYRTDARTNIRPAGIHVPTPWCKTNETRFRVIVFGQLQIQTNLSALFIFKMNCHQAHGTSKNRVQKAYGARNSSVLRRNAEPPNNRHFRETRRQIHRMILNLMAQTFPRMAAISPAASARLILVSRWWGCRRT